MKSPLLLLLTLTSFLGSCTSEPTLTMEFCTSLNANDQCPSDHDRFTLGDRVYVRLASDTPFETRKITGRIFRLMEEGEKYELGDKEFELEPGTTYITQNLPFHEFGYDALGTFSIEFSDGEGQLLARRELTIAK